MLPGQVSHKCGIYFVEVCFSCLSTGLCVVVAATWGVASCWRQQ